MNTTHRIILCIVVISIFYYIMVGSRCIEKEGFHGYCTNCGNNDRISCGNCQNCGFCSTDTGHGECVKGDETGPYFRLDCANWEYGTSIINYWQYPHYYNRYFKIYPRTRWDYINRNLFKKYGHKKPIGRKFIRYRSNRKKNISNRRNRRNISNNRRNISNRRRNSNVVKAVR